MNSITSIHSSRSLNRIFATVNALNGGNLLEPITGSFTWNGTTYTRLYAFTSTTGTNSISLNNTTTVGLIMCGGGGGGGCSNRNIGESGAGGGAGGMITGTISLNANSTYSITIGSSGTGAVASTITTEPGNSVPPTNGGNTVISGSGVGETSFGGGRGGYANGNGSGLNAPSVTNTGSNGGCGGGAVRSYNVGTAGLTTMSQSNCSTSTNSRSLTYRGFNGGSALQNQTGGGGGGATEIGGTGSGTNNAVAGLGGTGFLFTVTGSIPTNTFTNKYYSTGGCAGSANGITLNQSSIVSLGGTIGGTSSQPTPSNPTTYGTGGSGAFSYYAAVSASGANGFQGICIILVP